MFVSGSNERGKLGLPKDISSINSPTLLTAESYDPSFTHPAIDVGAGLDFSVIVDSHGRPFATGHNYSGQCGLGAYEHDIFQYTPMKFEYRVYSVSCGNEFTILLSDGQLYGCGHQESLRNPLYTEDEYCRILTAIIFPEKISKVACGYDHTLALSETGKLYVFGDNYCGQLGIESFENIVCVPTVLPWDKIITDVACQDDSSFIVSEGQLYGFGHNEDGALGSGHLNSQCEVRPQLVLGNFELTSSKDRFKRTKRALS